MAKYLTYIRYIQIVYRCSGRIQRGASRNKLFDRSRIFYNQQFFLRAGYFNENKYKGNRKYFSFGAGFSLNVLKIDAAYMVATAQTSPLDQTLRFTLSFDMDGLKDLLGRR